MRFRRGLAWPVLVLLVCVGILLAGTRWGDRTLYPPPAGSPTIHVFVVSNGYHSGLILPRPELAEVAGRDGRGAVLAVATRFRSYDWIETGWGEERFYTEVQTQASFNWSLALRALFRPGNQSVMLIVGVEGDPRPVYRDAKLVSLELSPEGFNRLVASLDESFARGADGHPEEIGPGIYGPSLFYRATGAFSLLNVCNHWTARLLDKAGVPVSPLVATLPGGLVFDLQLRSGLSPERLDAPEHQNLLPQSRDLLPRSRDLPPRSQDLPPRSQDLPVAARTP